MGCSAVTESVEGVGEPVDVGAAVRAGGGKGPQRRVESAYADGRRREAGSPQLALG